MKTNSKSLFQRTRTPALVVGSVSLLAILGQAGMAQVSKVVPAHTIKEEYVVYGNPNMSGGEDELAVNPTDPNNIIVGMLTGHNRLANGDLTDGSAEQRQRRLREAGNAYHTFAVTWDRGITWTYFDESHDHMNRDKIVSNYDADVVFAPDGTLYRYVERDGGEVTSSADKGKTWSANLAPDREHGMLGARLQLLVDNSTGALYITGRGTGTLPPPAGTPPPPAGTPPPQSYPSFLVSHDKGKTWSPPQVFKSAEYPPLGGGISFGMTAGNGRVADAFTSGTAAAAKIVFSTSKDDGKTFDFHVVPYQGPRPSIVELAGDQSKPGRYAVVTSSPDSTQVWVYQTEDYGNSWTKVVAAQAPKGTLLLNKDSDTPAARLMKVLSGGDTTMLWATKYAPKGGQLAILWRARYLDDSYDVWSSYSNDGGKTFKSLRVSNATSPAKSVERSNFLRHEDYWSLDFDNDSINYIYTGSQPGFLASWYARVPISDYLAK